MNQLISPNCHLLPILRRGSLRTGREEAFSHPPRREFRRNVSPRCRCSMLQVHGEGSWRTSFFDARFGKEPVIFFPRHLWFTSFATRRMRYSEILGYHCLNIAHCVARACLSRICFLFSSPNLYVGTILSARVVSWWLLQFCGRTVYLGCVLFWVVGWESPFLFVSLPGRVEILAFAVPVVVSYAYISQLFVQVGFFPSRAIIISYFQF